ncbi:MAG: hypothetical protein WD250_03780 [Egibacteraceae bacterium]
MASQAGLVNNLNEGMAWGLFLIYFALAGLGVARVGLLVAIAPAVWGIGQLATGALWDRIGPGIGRAVGPRAWAENRGDGARRRHDVAP